ncbi:uncharacterized protein BDR25DRAFT_354586 [Lindgomyces ingoldianus]|uniref:Uncharacterized protein n=1 Tax=Lindgomyces ingoldianus TaxID=673940 RepID=A0ACB6QWG5_9PLEO|nr:uncharacterized protein BDR25DRAFT_354586 [Lindgomyces ingoldianus]KAF2471344.1 hypothetical protein BDR25DRAFT_354586 [Lindgomyces ingoldianus]
MRSLLISGKMVALLDVQGSHSQRVCLLWDEASSILASTSLRILVASVVLTPGYLAKLASMPMAALRPPYPFLLLVECEAPYIGLALPDTVAVVTVLRHIKMQGMSTTKLNWLRFYTQLKYTTKNHTPLSTYSFADISQPRMNCVHFLPRHAIPIHMKQCASD